MNCGCEAARLDRLEVFSPAMTNGRKACRYPGLHKGFFGH